MFATSLHTALLPARHHTLLRLTDTLRTSDDAAERWFRKAWLAELCRQPAGSRKGLVVNLCYGYQRHCGLAITRSSTASSTAICTYARAGGEQASLPRGPRGTILSRYSYATRVYYLLFYLLGAVVYLLRATP